MVSQAEEPVAVFYSYHECDQNILKQLETFLSVLKRQRYIVTWHEGLVRGGELKQREVADHWEQSQIILLLVSSFYLADDACYAQMERAIARAEQGRVRMIPILVGPSSWQDTPIKDVQVLPQDKLPLSLHMPVDLAYAEIATEVGYIAASLRKRRDRERSSRFDDDYVRQQRTVSDVLPPYKHSSLLPREEYIHELYGKLTQPESTVLVLTGLAGIGKSTLAAQLYAYAEQQRQIGTGYFDVEPLWLVVTPALTLIALIEKIALALGWPVDALEKLSPGELALRLFHLLEQRPGRRLIVLDGFEVYLDRLDGHVRAEYDGIAEWLDLLNGAACASRILLTTRIMPRGKRITRHMYLQKVAVSGLTDQEGLRLLHLWNIRAPEKDLLHVVRLCKGHPLALVLLDGLLQNRHVQLSRLVDDRTYRRLWHNNVEQNLFNDIYKSMNVIGRHLLLACSIYREAFSWEAVCAVVMGQRQVSEERLQASFDILLLLSFLHVRLPEEEPAPDQSSSFFVAGAERNVEPYDTYYVLHPLVMDFASVRFSSEKKFNKQKAHKDAADYYQRQVDFLRSRKRRRDVQLPVLIELIWHLCQAEQWAQGYEVVQREQLFGDLRRRGAYAILLELAISFVQADSWQPGPEIIAPLLIEIGEVYHVLGKHDEAQHRFESALEAARAANMQAIQVRALNHLGATYRISGFPERALLCYQKANDIAEVAQEPVEQRITLNNMGRALQELGMKAATEEEKHKQYCRARDYYEQALILHRQADDALEEAQTLNNIGEINMKLHRFEEALQAYQQALQQHRYLGEKREEGIVCNNLGAFYRMQECYQDAFVWYTQALQLVRLVGARWDEGIVLRNLGSLFLHMQRSDLALACFLLARDLYEELYQPERGVISRGMQIILAGGEPFERVAATIGPRAAYLLEDVLARGFPASDIHQ